MSTATAHLFLASSIIMLSASPTILNLTPHIIDLFHTDEDGVNKVTRFPSEGPDKVVRVSESAETMVIERPEGSIPFTKVTMGEVENLPEETPGTLLIVSRMIFDACPTRTDLLAPFDFVRDDAGKIIGCKSFLTHMP